MIVITGAAGFIGSNLVADLQSSGNKEIVCADWFGDDERWRNLANSKIDYFVEPECLPAFLEQHSGEISSIIHMGAISATTERNVDRLVSLNINYSVMLWDWCARHNVPFIYASSAATYGGLEGGFIDDDSVEFLTSLRPLNAYGWSKNSTDVIFARRRANGKAQPPFWAGLKFFNVYGPNEYHKRDMMSVACKLYNQIKAGEKIQLFKSYRDDFLDGEQLRDFVYVKDCTRSILWFLENRPASGIYNIGTGNERSFADIAKSITKVIGSDGDIEFIDMPESIRDRYQYFTSADVTKLRTSGLDWPFHSLEDGIRDYVTQYLSSHSKYR